MAFQIDGTGTVDANVEPIERRPCHCPHCGLDLRDRPVSAESIASGYFPAKCPECGEANHLTRRVSICKSGSTKVVAYVCPYCERGWPKEQ